MSGSAEVTPQGRAPASAVAIKMKFCTFKIRHLVSQIGLINMQLKLTGLS